MSSNITQIPPDSTFKLPEGRFKAIIKNYKTKDVIRDNGTSELATILFEVQVPKLANFECLARKVVPVDLKSGSPMRRFLEGLLGAKYFKDRANQGVDLKALLEGRVCEVELIHAKHDEDRFDFPLVDVEAIYPTSEPTPVKVEGGQTEVK